jgi:GTP-binding protein EngB required for normal cell division
MNDNHQRHLLSTFQHVDNLLSEAERIMTSAGSASPFQEYSQDTTPIQCKVTHDYILRVREAMGRILKELQIPPKPPISGALWAARGHLGFASVAIAEIEPEHMRGYGELSDEDAQAMDRIVAELNAELNRIRDYLAGGATADLQSRIQRLEQTRDEVKLLRELDRIITAHGLIEFRNALVALLDRLEDTKFEIGVFGRVSSGKSSLLNYLLEAAVLPVGVTPVTAVPLRISFGDQSEVTIEFADEQPQQTSLDRLAEFSSEQQNPSNRKHVTRIRVRVPARRLREGVTFVDTPGLGSLATTGAEETVAYLPKCDLGIVLLDAGASLNHEDLVVVQSLYRAGATAMVLISKADLLTLPDRERMTSYVRQHLLSEVNLDLPVHLVSVMGEHAQLCDKWFESELKPLLEAHREATATSLKRKIGLLREAVADTLHARLYAAHGAQIEERAAETNRAAEELRGVNAVLEAAEKESRNIAYNLRESAPLALQTAADDIAAAWLNGSASVNAAGIFSASMSQFIARQSSAIFQSVEQIRARLSDALQQAHGTFGSRGRDRLRRSDHPQTPEELPKPTGFPAVDCSALATDVTLRKPVVLPFLGQRALRRFAESKLTERLNGALAEFLNIAGKRLEQWHRSALAELRDAFDVRAGMYRAALVQGQEVASTSEADIRVDLAILENWENQRLD